MIKSTSPAQLTLLPQPSSRVESPSALHSATPASQPVTALPQRAESQLTGPAPRAALVKKSRQSLWYCLYLPQLAGLVAEEQRDCLESLAQLVQEFSSAISVQPQAIVFEIRSGLNYFGGAESLHAGFK